MQSIYSIISEPRGEIYRRLIQSSVKFCDKFQVVIRPTINVSETCEGALQRLEPYLERRSTESQWPGTELLDGTAQLYRYRLTEDSAKLVSELAEGLYSWTQPDLPEDLCLVARSAGPWLITITHEKDGYFNLSTKDKDELLKMVPGLMLRKDHTYQ